MDIHELECRYLELIQNNNTERVIVDSVEMTASPNIVNIYFTFYQSTNKTIFCVTTNVKTYIKLQETMTRIIPYKFFIENIFALK